MQQQRFQNFQQQQPQNFQQQQNFQNFQPQQNFQQQQNFGAQQQQRFSTPQFAQLAEFVRQQDCGARGARC